MSRRWIVRSLVLAILVAAGALVWLAFFRPQPVPVTVVAAEPGRVEETVTNSRAGTVKARRRAKLSPEVGGRVVALPHREGDRVEKGEVVLRLEDDVYRAQLALAQRDLDASEAERQRACLAAQRAARERSRSAKLAADGIVSTDLFDQLKSQADTAAAACRAAEANAERARAAIGVARTQLSKTVLRAPFDGIVADVAIEVGEWTTPSPPAIPVPPVLDLIDPSSIYVSAPMDEVDSARIHTGQAVRVSVDSYRDRTFPGEVTRVAPYVLDVQEQNRTVEIEVTLDDDAFASRLLPGTSADVEVILSAKDGALRIPTGALLEGNRVLVLAGGVIGERSVELGLKNWDWTEVREGLAAGDEVVTSLDRPEVKAGAAARVVEAVAEPAAK
jgi:HlyD family secretion protein